NHHFAVTVQLFRRSSGAADNGRGGSGGSEVAKSVVNCQLPSLHLTKLIIPRGQGATEGDGNGVRPPFLNKLVLRMLRILSARSMKQPLPSSSLSLRSVFLRTVLVQNHACETRAGHCPAVNGKRRGVLQKEL